MAKTNYKNVVIKTLAEKFKNPNINIYYHVWADGYTELHSHEYFEMFFITKGKIEHLFNEQLSILDENSLCLIKPGDVHQFFPYDNEKSSFINICIHPAFFRTLCSIIDPVLHQEITSANELPTYKLSSSEIKYATSHIYLSRYTFNHTSSVEDQPVTTAIVVNFLLYFSYLFKSKSNYPEWFSKFIKTISNPNYFSKPLTDLRKESGYSSSALNNYFKLYTGKTLISYMIELKINYACSLLRSTNFTVLEIAMMASFNNLSNFNMTFKKITGKTPSEYKKQYHLS